MQTAYTERTIRPRTARPVRRTVLRRTKSNARGQKRRTHLPAGTKPRFFNLTGFSPEAITLADFYNKPEADTFSSLSVFLYDIFSSHPDFDHQHKWKKKPSSRDLFDHLIAQITKLFPEAPLRIELKGNQQCITLHHAYHLNGGQTVTCDFLPLLNRRNKTLLNLMLPFLAFIKNQIGQELWKSEALEQSIEQMRDCLYDCDQGEQRHYAKLTDKYTNGSINEWHRKVNDALMDPDLLKAKILTYKPRTVLTKAVKHWMLNTFKLYEQPYALSDFETGYKVFSDDQGEAHAHEAFRFVWTIDDNIYHWMDEYLNERAWGIGIIPHTYPQQLTEAPKHWDAIKMPSWIEEYNQWMSYSRELTWYLKDSLI
ncbi:hypothetical protein [Reichenbachiella sp.]|uniref:hypothetical protein n=1 Tax=Reichenbachiella sp. TaxID=2184521 RepID=UPI003263F287